MRLYIMGECTLSDAGKIHEPLVVEQSTLCSLDL